MAMMKGAAAGAAIGALTLATVLFVAPIAAQGPGPEGSRGAPADRSSGPETRPAGPPAAGRGDAGPAVTAPVPGRDRSDRSDSRDRGPDSAGRRTIDPNDPDITGPRGEFAACQQRLIARAQARLERIQRLTRPTDEQRPAFDELRTASMKGVEFLRSVCPAEEPLTPPARMALAEKWLEARLQASKVVRPALEAYFRILTDEQKIRWITGPRQWAGGMHEGRGMWDRPGQDRGRAPESGMRRGPEAWEDRGFDPRERFGFERRRGDEERWGGPQRPDERFGPYGRRGDDYGRRNDDRWRDDERYRWREPRWRDQSESDQFWRDQNWREQRDQSWREQLGRDPSWREGAPSWRDDAPRRERAPRDQRFRDDRSTTGGPDEERL